MKYSRSAWASPLSLYPYKVVYRNSREVCKCKTTQMADKIARALNELDKKSQSA